MELQGVVSLGEEDVVSGPIGSKNERRRRQVSGRLAGRLWGSRVANPVVGRNTVPENECTACFDWGVKSGYGSSFSVPISSGRESAEVAARTQENDRSKSALPKEH